MKKIISLLLFLFSLSTFAQNDFAILNLYREQRMCVGCSFKIYVNDVYVTSIENGGHLKYKIFKLGQTKIKIVDNVNYTSSVTMNAKSNGVYHVNFIKRALIKGNRIDIEILDDPIQDKKLKPEHFISKTDVGVLDIDNSKRPDTKWTKFSLKNHWNQSGIKDIEGIYEKVGVSMKYELAVLKENDEYRIIYIGGANGTSWNEGDIKANLQKTAQFGIFKAKWYNLTKSLNENLIITFEEATMSVISEYGEGKNMYLKIYPTYDENNDVNASEWISSGTGFFIDKNGYIATNYHVVNKGKNFSISVTKNGSIKDYNAELISSDKQNDLAVLKINDPKFLSLKSLDYNFNTKVQDVGSSVYALGYPLIQIMGNEVKFTDGKISSKSGYQGDITNYQISVPIQPGNSGGPLFNEKGTLVGITSSGLNNQIADNANFAIKTSYLKLLVESMDDKLELPASKIMKDLPVTEQIKALSEYVVLIKVK